MLRRSTRTVKKTDIYKPGGGTPNVKPSKSLATTALGVKQKVVKKKQPAKKEIIRDKKTLISYIDSNIQKTKGKDRLVWVTLKHIYSDSTDVGVKTRFKQFTNADISAYLNMQHETIKKPGSTLSDNLPTTVNIEMNDEKLINFLVMIWLDMTHDETVKLNMAFQDFLNSDYVKFLITTPVKFVQTQTINKLIEYGILKIDQDKLYRFNTSDKSVSDSALKNNIHNIWGNGKGKFELRSPSKIKSRILNPLRPIYMSLDSEDSNLNELIKYSKIGNNYYIKPLINVANLLDPGRGGGRTGQRGGTMNRITRQVFRNEPYTHYKFDVNTYKFVFGKYMTIDITLTNAMEYNVSVNGVFLNMGTTTAKAKSGGIIEKMSKFMGDFAQIITVAHQYKSGLRVVSGTLDGVFVGITAFIHKELFGLKPRIMFDNSTYGVQNAIIMHGFDDIFITNDSEQPSHIKENIKLMNAIVSGKNNSRATTRILSPKGNVKSVSKGNTQSTKKSTPPPTTRKRPNPPSRNNTAEMSRLTSSVSQRQVRAKRVRSSTNVGSSQSQRSTKQIKLSASNMSSGTNGKRSPNSVTQTRSRNGKVESITRTVSAKPESIMRTASAKPESIMRTVSARPNTSNSAKSNQTQG